ncbi:MAG: hypothetical protein M1831_001369 [Alyxoria varia]|nr:MAG: hypothetical protein M1831_001369 [Alyxoria varia]
MTFNTPTTSIWEDAYQNLPQAAKEGLAVDQSASMLDIQKLVIQARDDADARRLTVKTKSKKTFVVRDAFEKVARWIGRFIQVGDLAVQYDPGHAALPWAAASINNLELHAAVHDGLDDILHNMCWARIQEGLSLGVPFKNADRLRKLFVLLYVDVLTFLSKACHFLKQNRTRQALTSVFSLGGSEYEEILKSIYKHKASIEDFTAQIRHEGHNQHKEISQELLSILTQMRSPMQRVENFSAKAVKILEDHERKKLLNWASRIPYQKHYIEAQKKALEGTGNWLLSHPRFIQWKDSSSSEILWLHGIPGSGKTTLVSILLKTLIEESQSRSCSTPTYFYCARNSAESDRSNPEQVLRCIVRQAANPPKEASVHQSLNHRYEEHGSAGTLSLDESIDTMIDIVKDRCLTYVVVDALDECAKDTRQDLVNAFSRLLQESSGLVKLFISSRDDLDIVLHMNAYPDIKIEAQDNKDDILRYVESSVDRLICEKKLLPTETVTDSLREEIKQSLNDVNSKNDQGRTAVHAAASRGHTMIVEYLAKRDDVQINPKDNEGRIPLHLAAASPECGSIESVELLANRNDVDADSKDERGQTPLHIAAATATFRSIKAVELLSNRSDVDADSKDESGQTPLHKAATSREYWGIENVDLLANRDDVDADSKDGKGQTPLHKAAYSGFTQIVELLANRDDVDVNSKDNQDHTPLGLARMDRWLKSDAKVDQVVELLRERGGIR